MSKDLSFRLRLDADDRRRLEAIAAHYCAPASTAVRMLIKEKHDSLPQARAEGTILRTKAKCSVAGKPSKPLAVRYLDARETLTQRGTESGRTYTSDRVASTRDRLDDSLSPMKGWIERQLEPDEAVRAQRQRLADEFGGTLEVERAPGRWGGWYLTTLLGDTWTPESSLALDGGSQWHVDNIFDILEEVKVVVGPEKFEAIQFLSRKIVEDDAATHVTGINRISAAQAEAHRARYAAERTAAKAKPRAKRK